MTLTYFNDVTVYFHMRNHYRALKHVKSVVDTSLPGSLVKSPMALRNLDKRLKGAANEHLRRIYHASPQSLTPKPRGAIKKHNCLNVEAKSEASLLAADLPSRSCTRRQPKHNIEDYSLPARSCSASREPKMFKFRQKKKRPSVGSNRSTNSASETQSMHLDLQPQPQCVDKSTTPPGSSKRSSSVYSPQQVINQSDGFIFGDSPDPEDHDYLLFLLRITEDIISNDFYSNSDIKRIFKTHIDMNKHRLDVKKMHLHIANLCKELNIDCKDFQVIEPPPDNNSVPPDQFQTQHIFSEAFKSCQDCSVIRSSTLYGNKSRQETINDLTVGDRLSESLVVNGDDAGATSFSPSLLRLLEKLSLGRVTERTEPVASSSTVESILNGSAIKAQKEEEKKIMDSCPKDFDTFVKELNKDEVQMVLEPEIMATSSEEELIGLASLTSEHLTPNQNPVAALLPPFCNKPFSETSNNLPLELTSTDVMKPFLSIPKSPPEDALLLDSPVEKATTETDITVLPEHPLIIEKCASNTSLVTSGYKSEPTSKEVDSNKSSSRIPILVKNCCEPERKLAELPTPDKSVIVCPAAPSQFDGADKLQAKSATNNGDHLNLLGTSQTIDTTLKLILPGPIRDEDYIMLKGPVYIYKPLLETEPKLVLTGMHEGKLSRSSSPDSHRTFIVESSPHDASLHSLEMHNSSDNILELTRAAYSQFADMKLMHSDYDLTPEKDQPDNKYHHLMVDASSSVSGVNITENLLLNDDYLVVKDLEDSVNRQTQAVKDENYVKWEPKLYENCYVVHRKLVSSVSMPKMKLNERKIDAKRGLLVKQSSEQLEVVSQDSSLRSEGEAVPMRHNGKQASFYVRC